MKRKSWESSESCVLKIHYVELLRSRVNCHIYNVKIGAGSLILNEIFTIQRLDDLTECLHRLEHRAKNFDANANLGNEKY